MIHTRGLRRQFQTAGKAVEAVGGLDLDVEQGELVAFLGPNGAGKSTTLRMLTTLLSPTSGRAAVAGCDVAADASRVRRRIGYVGQGNGAGHAQKVRDELVCQGRCYGLSRAQSHKRADELLLTLELNALAQRTVDTLSGGQRRRLDVALGLVHRPELLFLDEPSTGLDPQNRANLREHILRLREEYGTTVFLTTHYLDEADTMAERVLIIDHGRVIADDTPEGLKAALAGDRITLSVGDASETHRIARTAERMLPSISMTTGARKVTLGVSNGPAVLPELLRALEADGVRVLTAEVVRPTLDDVFLALTGRSLREEGEASTDHIQQGA